MPPSMTVASLNDVKDDEAAQMEEIKMDNSVVFTNKKNLCTEKYVNSGSTLSLISYHLDKMLSDTNGNPIESLTGLNICKRLRKWSRNEHDRKQFGISLECIQRSHNLSLDRPIPPIVIKCVEFLSLPEHLVIEGIFRKSPQVSKVKKLQDAVNSGKEIIFKGENMAMLVAVLLKTVFRELSEPLLTVSLFEDVIQFPDVSMEERENFVIQLLEELPENNYVVLKYLIEFLSMVGIYNLILIDLIFDHKSI